jgi:hypothetical protein
VCRAFRRNRLDGERAIRFPGRLLRSRHRMSSARCSSTRMQQCRAFSTPTRASRSPYIVVAPNIAVAHSTASRPDWSATARRAGADSTCPRMPPTASCCDGCARTAGPVGPSSRSRAARRKRLGVGLMRYRHRVICRCGATTAMTLGDRCEVSLMLDVPGPAVSVALDPAQRDRLLALTMDR